MRRTVIALLGGCVPEIDLGRPGDAPTAVIVAPVPDAQVVAGPIGLVGRVSDLQDDAVRLLATWSVGTAEPAAWRQACLAFAEADGTTRCSAVLEAGDTHVRLLVTDVAGFQGEAIAAVGVAASAAPSVILEAPAPGPWRDHLDIPVVAVAQDADHPATSLSWRWTVDGVAVDGPDQADGDGRVMGVLRLLAGEHALVARVTDPVGVWGEAAVRFVVWPEDEAPRCAIEVPTDGMGALPGAALAVTGLATDDVTPTHAIGVGWTWDGARVAVGGSGPGGRVSLDLDVGGALGPHVLGLEVTDDTGHLCEDAVTVVIDEAPTLSVTTPAEGETLVGEVLLTLVAADATSAAAELDLSVESDRDGPILRRTPGDDGTLRAAFHLTDGAHRLSVTVTDGLGLSTTVHRQVTVTR